MSGPTDQPETVAPAASRGDDLTLEGILREHGCLAPAVRPLTAHELAVQGFAGCVPQTSTSGRLHLEVADPAGAVVAWARSLAGREVGIGATWARFRRSDLGRGALCIVSTPDPYGGADLLVMAERGMLGRGLLVDVSRWLFLALGLSRVTAHVPTDRADLGHLLRRGGFAFEGVSRGYFHGVADASRWSMLARDCRWLGPHDRPAAPAIQAPAAAPPFDRKMH